MSAVFIAQVAGFTISCTKSVIILKDVHKSKARGLKRNLRYDFILDR